MFNKTKPTAQPPQPSRPAANPVSIPPLPDLPSSTQARRVDAPAAAPTPAPAASRNHSVLSSDLTFEGNITGGGDLQVDGAIKGDVKVGRLTVGETGSVEGGVTADYVEVRGRVVGAVSGKQVKLMSTAYVDGDITHEQLSIDVGAYFQGRCVQGRQAAPAPAAQPAPVAAPVEDKPQIIEMKSAG